MYPLSRLKVDEWLKEEIYLPGGEDMRWILSFMIPHPLASSLFPGSTMDIKTVRGYDLTEYLPDFLHYRLSNLSKRSR